MERSVYKNVCYQQTHLNIVVVVTKFGNYLPFACIFDLTCGKTKVAWNLLYVIMYIWLISYAFLCKMKF